MSSSKRQPDNPTPQVGKLVSVVLVVSRLFSIYIYMELTVVELKKVPLG